MKKVLVSIVIPLYNMEQDIEKCLESIFKQDYDNIEVIVVDDGSTDNSFNICNNIAKKNKKLKVFHTENNGSGPARNYGIEKSSGKYIYFPDADDYMEPTAITKMVEAMCNGENDLVVFGYKSINQIGKVVRCKKYPNLSKKGDEIRDSYSNYFGALSPLGIQGAPWNKFFDLSILKKNKVSFPPLRRHQDEAFIAKYMCYASNIKFIQDILYVHYTNDLKTEWRKYPINYIDSAIGLYESRKETILKWNKNDLAVKQLVENEYVSNVIKALELSFSPKMKFNKQKRKKWIIDTINKTKIINFIDTCTLGKYQRYILKLINKKRYNLLYITLYYKIKIEMTKLYMFIRGK